MELIIIFIGIILDRFTKIWAINNLSQGNDVVIMKNFFALSYLENRGAAFGIFQNKLLFLTIITLIILGLMIYFILKYKPSSKIFKIGSALIIGGALGNLIDRIKYKFVVDFILLHYKDIYYYPTFNIADVMVVIGTILIAIYLIKEDKYGK